MTSDPGSFAQRTFQTRIPRIIDDVIAMNDYPPEIIAALRALRAEVVSGTLELIREASDDQEFWNAQARAWRGTSWLALPWYWAEAFFYRRVLEATRYFQPGDFYARDPYAPVKRAELQPNRAPRAVNEVLEHLPRESSPAFHALVRASVWGNRVDLSMLGAITATATDHSLLLVDDSASVEAFLRGARGRVDFICDNLKVIISTNMPTHEMENLMEVDIDAHQREALIPYSSVNRVADSLPGFGIVAAVLGVVLTMNKIDQPPDVLGHSIGAALVGTFLGVLLCYGFVGPMAFNLEHQAREEETFYSVIKVAMVAFVGGAAPQLAVEFGRRAIPSKERPTFNELEEFIRK